MCDHFRIISLTPELVASCHHDVPDSDPELEYEYFEDSDYDRAVAMLLAQQPGYMICLDHGGRCEGILYRLPEAEVANQLWQLLYREVGSFEALESVR